MEGDSKCVICWASSTCKLPWKLLDVVEELVDLARNLSASFSHARQSANKVADALTNESCVRV